MPKADSMPSPPRSLAACPPSKWIAQDGAKGNLLEEVKEFAKLTPYKNLGWQAGIVETWSSFGADGKWVHHRCGASVPRQAGKSVVAIVWVLFLAAILGYKVLWTDHNYSTTCEMLARFRKIVGHRPHDGRGVKALNRLMTSSISKTAQEAFEFRSGGVIAFSTRTDSAGLGYSFDIIVLDEAQELLPEHLQAILPTTSSGEKKNSQFIYLGTPTRAGSNATNFTDLRNEAIGEDCGDDLCWAEWGVNEVGDVLDTDRLYSVNPALVEGRADLTAIVAGIRSFKSDVLAAAQEYYGYWLPAATANSIISREEWDACGTPDAPGGEADAFGIKFSPDGLTVSIAMAKLEGETTHVELIAAKSTALGTRWLANAIVKNAGRASFVIDGRSGAKALYDRVEKSVPDGSVSVISTGDAIAAASGFLDAVRERAITWYKPIGNDCDDLLSLSALSSVKRKIGNSGGWGFGGDDPTPVEAAALARWCAQKIEDEGEDMEVYF